MIHLDLTNDAPVIESDATEDLEFIKLITATKDDLQDEVVLHEQIVIPVSASVRSRTTMGLTVIQYSIRHRYLPGPGPYKIHCWTRRGQPRRYVLEFTPVKADPTKCVLTIGAESSPCTWVTENETHQSKGTPLSIELVQT